MELSAALNEIQPIIASVAQLKRTRNQNPLVLARAIEALLETNKAAVAAMTQARKHMQAAEAIRKQESPRSIAALEREAKKRESE